MATTNRPVESLTNREIEVLKLIATGMSTKDIAGALGIAFKTAACHRSRIMAKLEIHEVANITRNDIPKRYVEADGKGQSIEETKAELLDPLRIPEAKCSSSLAACGAFLRDRETIGLESPDSSTGARRLRQAE